jgi:putative heme iron utilization protein
MLTVASHGALATVSAGDGFPEVSRVGLAALNGVPLTLISALSAHTAALRADQRCSLMVGEAGKGDPLAHPRIMMRARARELVRGGEEHTAARAAYLAAQPKSQLYIDFADFTLMALEPLEALFNAGFGQAYKLTGVELVATAD